MRAGLFFVAMILLLLSCENDPGKVAEVTKKDSLPVMTTQEINLQYTDSGRLTIRLKAPVAEEYAGVNPYTLMPKGVFVEFFDDSGKVNTSLKSNYALRNEREQFMEAKYDVQVVNIKGEKLNTEKLMWDGKQRKIYTDAFVKITTADQVIMGNGMEADETFSEYEIKDITGTIMLNE